MITNELVLKPVLAPWWRRARWWLLIAAAVICAGVITALANQRPAEKPLDPSSPSQVGSQALARMLGQAGVTLARRTDLTSLTPGSTVLITEPLLYSDDQLSALAANHRLVLIEPEPSQLALFGAAVGDLQAAGDARVAPGCQQDWAVSAGVVDFPEGYSYPGQPCFNGRVLLDENVVALGSAQLLANDHLANDGVAAVDINLITDNRQVRQLDWVMASLDTQAEATQPVSSLFPAWTSRATAWLTAVSLLLMLWKGRRFAPVVREPLPVVVRSVELVEGHGRLYRRARARAQAAVLLRAATTRRLAARLGLPPRSGPHEVAAALRRSEDAATLTGPPPDDDAALMALARNLDLIKVDTSNDEPPDERNAQ